MKILIVEDNNTYKEELIHCLIGQTQDMEIIGSAVNGMEGLDILEKCRTEKRMPDVVFTDIRMPKMDGFEMLETINSRKMSCKVVVTSSCPEFFYIKRAMELGAFDFLLKPVKEQEVRRVLWRLQKELEYRDNLEHFLNLEYIFLSAAMGQIREDLRMEKLIDDRYGIRPLERIGIFEIGMGSNYEEYRQQVKRALQELEAYNQTFCAYPMDISGCRSLVTLFYHMEDEEELQRYLEQTIVPMLGKEVRGRMVCIWEVSDGFRNMQEAIGKMDRVAEWNLILEKGTLICEEKIQEIILRPYKYPVILEKEAKESLARKDKKRFKETFARYRAYCRKLPCTPQEAKEGCIRIALVLIQMAAEAGAVQAQKRGQIFLREISRADGWTDIEEKVDLFFEYLTQKNEEKEDMSLLMKKALENIREYYNQGITLEEIAEKLHVTEEYLSSQFRKETGQTFTEIMKKYRIEHVKELLTTTHFKLNQIAGLVGYADPKYMSRVFKEETGMLPLEYRKKNG